LLLFAVGQTVTVTLSDGTKLEAVFYTATPFSTNNTMQSNKYVFKQIRVLEPGTTQKFEPGSTAILSMQDVVHVVLPQMPVESTTEHTTTMTTSSNGAFQTDTEISGAAGTNKNKVLEAAGAAWVGGAAPVPQQQQRNSRADALMGPGGAPSETPSGLQGNIGQWDQFQANEALFNVKATFDENLYTTSLDKSKMDAQQIKAAEKLAKEIESQTSTNIHVAEERGFKLETDFDEEDLYSGVLKQADGSKQVSSRKDGAAVPAKVMNYAAAAAKQTSLPPGFLAKQAASAKPSQTPKEETSTTSKQGAEASTKLTESSKEPKPSVAAATPTSKESVTKTLDAATETAKTDASKAATPSTKLNPNAKSFSLNISAKPFTPTFAADPMAAAAPMHHVPMPYGPIDPHTGMPLAMDPNVMAAGHHHPFMHPAGPMGHPGTFCKTVLSERLDCVIVSFILVSFLRYDGHDGTAVSWYEVSWPFSWNGAATANASGWCSTAFATSNTSFARVCCRFTS
jgi:hypothetical protein